jgi:hypothetical protein
MTEYTTTWLTVFLFRTILDFQFPIRDGLYALNIKTWPMAIRSLKTGVPTDEKTFSLRKRLLALQFQWQNSKK